MYKTKLNKHRQLLLTTSIIIGIFSFIILLSSNMFGEINPTSNASPSSSFSFIEVAKTMGENGAPNDKYGIDVEISGNTAIVGAFLANSTNGNDTGAAYIYVIENGIWVQQAKLEANDSVAGDQFGLSVAISGDTAVIGAGRDDIGGNFNEGSVYIFTRSDSNWTQSQKLTANDGIAESLFGVDVAISNNHIVIGANDNDVGANDKQGSAYVFVYNGQNWVQQQKLVANDGDALDSFGTSVGINNSRLIVGAYRDDVETIENQGSAYVYTNTGSSWIQEAKLVADNGSANDDFGVGVDIYNDTAVIGAWTDDIGSNSNQGSVYVFRRSGSAWSQEQILVADDGAEFDNFGVKLDLFENTVLIGSWLSDANTNFDQGASYIFKKTDATWVQSQKLLANDGLQGDNFGSGVAIGANALIVGSFNDDINANQREGSAYIFENLKNSNPIFDFDGDGKTDVSIFRPAPGQWWYLQSSDLSNAAFAFGTNTDKLVPADYTGDGKTDIAFWRESTGEWFILRSEDSSFYGFPFGTAGDIPAPGDFDGDGIADAAVFRPSTATWFIQRSSDGGTTITPFGISEDKPTVADFDGDGKDDIAIFRPSVSQWWQLRSQDGVIAYQFGASGDKTIQGDYTGDGKADVGVFRPSTGQWLILRSEDTSFFGFPFGTSTDIPSPGDYDGDGTFDAAVFRPSTNTWFYNGSTSGNVQLNFGITGDIPIPNVYSQE